MSVSRRRKSARCERTVDEALPAIRDTAASLAVAILHCNKQQIARDVFCGTILLFDAENRRARWLGSNPASVTNLHLESCNSTRKAELGRA
jgi:hypothetical protein